MLQPSLLFLYPFILTYTYKKMKKLIGLFFLSLSFGIIHAQKVTGYVYDAETYEPLPGVSVIYSYKDATREVITDLNGFYDIEVPADAVTVSFSYLGYEQEDCRLIISGQKTKNQNIYLKTDAKILDEVIVSAGRYEQKLNDITVSMELLKPRDIEKQSPTDLRGVLGTIPGVDITDKQPSIRSGSGWTYGVGSRSLIMVDGMSVLTPGVGEINWNIIPMENIQQVEVIKGASSVLYGSSALNGLINVRTNRPGLDPETRISTYVGIYGEPDNEEYRWWDKGFWEEGKYEVKSLFRNSLFYGIRNPMYNGIDFSHSRRIGDFDVSGAVNIFTDEGYRKGGYNKRMRAGGNLTYHDPNVDDLNYGFTFNSLTNDYGDFFIWRSPSSPYESSAIANMGRQHNMLYVDPFLNYYNLEKNTTHKFKSRFFYKTDNIYRTSRDNNLVEILQNMGIDGNTISDIAGLVENPSQLLTDLLPPLLNNDLNGLVNGVVNIANTYLPNASQEDYVDLIGWVMNNSIPTSLNDLPQWALGIFNPVQTPTELSKTYSYYLDYQFSKQFSDESVLTTGVTYEHITTDSQVTGKHVSDNAALFGQYDRKFFDRLNLSLGMRFEYYRVDSHKREAETNVFGLDVPVKPVLRAGLNYQLADYTFLRASFGQGYRYPSMTEKFAVKDIGGIGAYPNFDLKPEQGYNIEVGAKQGYKVGPFMGFLDIAGFYTYYKNMIEFNFGVVNPDLYGYPFITNFQEVIDMVFTGRMPGIGVKFSNVSRARIYGVDLSISGMCDILPQMKLIYNMGYTFTEPIDVDADKINAEEEANTDALAFKTKSNTSKYLKYRQKHSVKGTFDLQWKRFSVGTNMSWKSKTLAVDYLMLDERQKLQPDIMDYVRSLLFGDLHNYWLSKNKGYYLMDLRFGLQVSKNVYFQYTINNLLNKEYSPRPMDVAAPQTHVVKMNILF